MLAKLSEKIDDFKATKAASSDNEGEENNSPYHDGERDDVTTCDKSGNVDGKGTHEDDGVGEQRLVDNNYYRHKIKEGFA